MNRNHVNTESALDALRAERAAPEARERALDAIRHAPSAAGWIGIRTPKARWALSTLAVGTALVVLPLVLRTSSSTSFAAGWQQSLDASMSAPSMRIRVVVARGSKLVLWSEDCYASGKATHRTFDSRFPLADYRTDGRRTYVRYRKPPYESVSSVPPSRAAALGLSPAIFTVDSMLRSMTPANKKVALDRVVDTTRDGRAVRRYVLAVGSRHGGPSTVLVDTDPGSKRIVRIEYADGSHTSIEYPASIDPAVFEPPAKPLAPRFDLADERAAVRRMVARGLGRAQVGHAKVELLAVLQDTGGTVYVVSRGGRPGADSFHSAFVDGMPVPFNLTMGPKARATAVAFRNLKRSVTAANVKLPLFADGRFAGYATFSHVPVRRTLPVDYFRPIWDEAKG